ncbi:histidine kinase [Stutzerimonas tarimensis]|uniref:histidine kinase n=1 Tax=Stutzerimonas tarimensis TaxID=1507735 RepID=A0ABV7T2N2_9GAMM
MSVVGRANLLVSLFFGLVALVCMAVLLRQAGHDVQRELLAAQTVVDYLAESVARDGGRFPPELDAGLRHVDVVRIEPGTAVPLDPRRSWLSEWLYPDPFPARLVHLSDGGQLRLSVDPSDEVEEVAESLWQLLALLSGALMVCLVAIRWAIGRAMQMLERLLSGLQSISRGRLATRLDTHRLPEAQQVVAQFNGMASALQSAEAENALLTRRLIELQERERTRLAQVLHDDLGQYLAAIRAQACLLSVQADNAEAVRRTAAILEAHSLHLQDGFRTLVRDLYPVMLEHLELDQAVRQLAGQWQSAQGIECRLRLDPQLPTLDIDRKVHLYRLLQEALTNIARHSRASRVQLQLRRHGRGLRLLLKDNGHGQPPGRPGIGLRSMAERASCLGGELRFRQRPGSGWSLYLSLPSLESS